MKLTQIYVRYFPPGLAFNYNTITDKRDSKCIEVDLYELTATSNINTVMISISNKVPGLLTKDIEPQVRALLEKIQLKLKEPIRNKYYLFKTLHSHILPLTNVAFDRTGDLCITGSYDRTCRVWNVDSGTERAILKGHENVVFSVGFNFPKSDKILTGSFDKTAKIWSTNTGTCLNTLWGHSAEIVGSEFSHGNNELITTASMDSTCIVWSTETGQEIYSLRKHTAEVIAAHFNTTDTLVVTGSFDGTSILWDLRTSTGFVKLLSGHTAELSNCIWNFSCTQIATSSLDSSIKIWDFRNSKCALFTMKHNDEVLDITYNYNGLLASCSSDSIAKVWQIDGTLLSTLTGHSDEISKICFSPNGRYLLTASADKTARLWNFNDDNETSKCVQIMRGHDSDVFSCAFNYSGDAILTASKDNTCKIWR